MKEIDNIGVKKNEIFFNFFFYISDPYIRSRPCKIYKNARAEAHSGLVHFDLIVLMLKGIFCFS